MEEYISSNHATTAPDVHPTRSLGVENAHRIHCSTPEETPRENVAHRPSRARADEERIIELTGQRHSKDFQWKATVMSRLKGLPYNGHATLRVPGLSTITSTHAMPSTSPTSSMPRTLPHSAPVFDLSATRSPFSFESNSKANNNDESSKFPTDFRDWSLPLQVQNELCLSGHSQGPERTDNSDRIGKLAERGYRTGRRKPISGD